MDKRCAKAIKNLSDPKRNEPVNQQESTSSEEETGGSTLASSRRYSNLPAFTGDLNIDGVKILNNTNMGEFIPILFLPHSIAKSSKPGAKVKRLKRAQPFIVGLYHGKKKPCVRQFLKKTIAEFKRLDPDNLDKKETAGRQFTLKLRSVRTDGPMRSFLKRIKSHAGYNACERCIQKGIRCKHRRKKGKTKNMSKKKKRKPKVVKTIQLLNVNAPPRVDEDFLNYHEHTDCEDDHIPNISDRSPFLDNDFPMISGFVIDPMHTVHGGSFLRLLEGLVKVPAEGKLSNHLLARVDKKLSLFKACKPIEFDRFVRSFTECVSKYKHHELRHFLYYLIYPVFHDVLNEDMLDHAMKLHEGMLLLGGFNPNPIPQEDIDLSSQILKQYAIDHHEKFKFPIRFSTHETIHVPDDCENFKCGVECMTAYVFENFERIFRQILRSGNLVIEQMTNRLIERSKFILPTNSDGLILTHFEEMIRESQKMKLMFSDQSVVLAFNEKKNKKELVFPTFTITNQFPDNICLLKNGSVVVCTDIIEEEKGSCEFILIGYKFYCLENAYSNYFPSSKFNIYIASKIKKDVSEWNVNGLKGKMYALPFKYNETQFIGQLPDILNAENKWYVSPIFHTLY